MLLQHSISYFLIRGISGLTGLLAIYLFTRLLTPAEYGLYALTLAGVSIVSTVFFQWLNIGLTRFMPAHREHPQIMLATVTAGYACSLLATGVALGLLVWCWPDQTTTSVLFIGGLVAWGQAWFELTLRLANSRLSFVRYGLLSVTQSIAVVAAGTGFVYLGYGVQGLLVGMFAGTALSSAVLGWKEWTGIKGHHFSRDLLVRLLRYGVPLTVMSLLILIVDVSGRLFLGWYSNTSEVGVYAVTCDLVQWSLTMLMGVVNLAGFPLIVQALEGEGARAADSKLREYALIIFGVGIPSATGMCVLADNVTGVFLGKEFHRHAAMLMPWLAVAVFFGCAKSFYFDLSFQLSGNTGRQAVVATYTAVVNILLNIWLIPIHGALGASISMVMALGGGMLASWYFGTRKFKVPLHRDTYKIIMASLGMALALWPSRAYLGLAALVLQLGLGVLTYIALATLFNIEGTRAIAVSASRALWNHLRGGP